MDAFKHMVVYDMEYDDGAVLYSFIDDVSVGIILDFLLICIHWNYNYGRKLYVDGRSYESKERFQE